MTNVIGRLADLHYLFDKKKFGDAEFTVEELEFAKRFQHSKLVKSLVDPSVPFGIEDGYVPSAMEIEIAFVVVSGRVVEETPDIKSMIRVISNAIKCAEDLAQLYAGEA